MVSLKYVCHSTSSCSEVQLLCCWVVCSLCFCDSREEVMEIIDIIETQKGKPCALYNGFSYRKLRENKQGVITWVCLKQKSDNCKGKLFSNNNSVVRVADHQCVPDEATIDVKKCIFKAKKRARENSRTPLRQVFSEEFDTLQSRGYELVCRMPQFSNLKSTLYLNRKQAQGVQAEPRQPEDLVLHEDTLKMTDGSSFLLADDGIGKDRLLIFAGTKGRESLGERRSCFMDGTFKSCSIQFHQVYTIHVDLGSTPTETNVAPVIFALLPNKKKETYKRMFQLIVKEVPDWSPESVNMDFEASVIAALQESFPSVVIHGCHFHFSQSLWRKVQDVGLATQYKKDLEIRSHVRMCAALAFLKPEDVEEGWLYIQQHAPSNERLVQFFDYFVDQWLENQFVTKEMWNCYNRRHRTNNPVEGWNHRLNSLLGRHHPRIRDLITRLRKEAEDTNLKVLRMEMNLEGVKRRKQYIVLDERVQRTTKKYEEDGDVGKLLTTMSYILSLG